MTKLLVIAALLLGSVARVEAAEKSGLEQSADAVLIGLPVAALGLTFLLQDEPADGKVLGFDALRMTGAPRHDLGLALMRTSLITYGLKYTVDEERPNGEDGSFPSGHTAITFAGAEFIRKEYGWAWGTPAYAAASFVGWSRVESEDHWWHDVAVGALIGMLSNHDLSEFSTRWGDMSVKPALMRALPDFGSMRSYDAPAAAPALQMEFRF